MAERIDVVGLSTGYIIAIRPPDARSIGAFTASGIRTAISPLTQPLTTWVIAPYGSIDITGELPVILMELNGSRAIKGRSDDGWYPLSEIEISN